ncbi:uncharacterized bromodomain-containing protein 10 isoform X2 [Ambystoma mexicanum]|uniref:uncharacterized bromodomain-containing protein 10 isoform X2 n=1 Tax=Ambystoma mexicanum TaxID=8296 RepID=UPI0037E81CB3
MEEEVEPGAPGWEVELSPELRQGLRILRDFLLEKHRGLVAAFLQGEAGEELGLLAMEEGFRQRRYQELGEFVADFRLMLENCYRRRGVEHWMSKQGQRLEGMLEQKLALLSRPLREKTAIVVTSKGRYGLEDEKVAMCTSTRRRSTPRSLAGGLQTGAFESIMVQALRQEEQLKAKQDKRTREQGKKEAEEASYKEVEEWEKNLLAQAAPTSMENMWEIPAIGHFLCLAQQILNLPEIIYFELERCLLMPQSNVFLSKIMTSLLSPPHRRPSLHRRPPLSYRSWEAALRQKVQQWYSVVGHAEKPDSCAEKLGLCAQFFRVLGDVSPLEEKPFHELSFYQKAWLLKGLCDFVYETQTEVQDAVLGQPIHECREVILGYDSQENAYIHFPQFCGADVRIYKQIPFPAPEFPIPPIKVRRPSRIKLEKVKCEPTCNANGDVRLLTHEKVLMSTKAEVNMLSVNDCSVKFHMDCSCCTEHDTLGKCEVIIQRSCDVKKDSCCKENLEKPIPLGVLAGFGDLLSPGEIRVVENGEKYVERPLCKTEPSPLKENALKTCQAHVNGGHSDKPDINCHRVAKDIILERSLLNCKKIKLLKLHGKKKKKKKKKHLLNENLHGKYAGLQSQPFKSYKSEIHSKLFLNKKKAKHKKHKSGKKSISKRAITKKRKIVSSSPTTPEFQLVCTNLDELRELITKIDVELKEFGNNRKKSGKSFVRKQTVRELHSTLKRLLKELLPWEPKLMKAFHRNRARLKKDYEDFQKLPDIDTFSREAWINEETEIAFGKESLGIDTKKWFDISENSDSLKKDDPSDSNLPDMGLAEKSPLQCKELFPEEILTPEMPTTLPKTCKRPCKHDCCEDGTQNSLPNKKIKLGICESETHCMEGNPRNDCCSGELKHTKSEAQQALCSKDSETSFSGQKFITPIQALLAKNSGNKVTLSNQLMPNLCKNINHSEISAVSSAESSPTKSTFSASTRNPLQVVYKMPGGQCVPVDLQSNSVKIQVQPVLDPKTGEKRMQQVIILPKNFFLQQKEGTSAFKESLPLQLKSAEQQCAPFPQATNVDSSFSSTFLREDLLHLPSSMVKKNFAHLATLGHPVLSPPSPKPVQSASQTQANLSEISTITTTTFPISSTLSSVSTAVLPSISLATSSDDSGNLVVTTNETVQKASNSSEINQELKTICIRDSQSILVRTRGGNTGVVKVQANLGKCSTNSLTTSSVFTCTPQTQAFLLPRVTTLPCSTVSSLPATTTMSTVLPFAQSTVSQFSSSPSVSSPAGLNPLIGKHVKLATGQPSAKSFGHLVDKNMHSHKFLSSSTLSNSWLPTTSCTSLASINAAGASLGSVDSVCMGQIRSVVNPPVAPTPSEIVHKTDKQHTVNETANPGNVNVISGAPVQKLLIVTPPGIAPSNPATVGTIPTPTSSAAAPQKFVFLNTNISSGSSVGSVAAESAKQVLPSVLGKAFLNTSEKPHLVLIPSTAGAPIKLTPSSVSQVKEVKIGLNIGQTIINTTGSALNVPPFNLLQNAPYRRTNDNPNKGFVLPVTASNLVPLCTMNQNTSSANESVVGVRESNSCTGTTVNTCIGSISATKSNASIATPNTDLLNHGNDSGPRILPFVGNRLCTPNSVAISTVKTSHLASSVLISTTQSAMAPQSIPTTLFPNVVSLPASVTNAQKNLAPMPVPCVPSPKGQPQTLLCLPPPGNAGSLITSSNIQKPQTIVPSSSTNVSKVIGISNFASLPPSTNNALLPCSSEPGVSSVMQPTIVSPFTNQVGQFGESCVQQKIVLNTSTPLAPGTQIMINGTRFVVPPHGLVAGSHVLLISTNSRQGPQLGNTTQGVQMPLNNSAIPNNIQGSVSWQLPKHPLKSSTNIGSSLGTAVTPPNHSILHVVNTVGRASAASTANIVASIPRPKSTPVAKTSVFPPMHGCSAQLPSSTSTLHLDSSVKKLLVSPEGAILNSINTSITQFSPLPPGSFHVVDSPNKTLPTLFPTALSSGSDTVNIDAS